MDWLPDTDLQLLLLVSIMALILSYHLKAELRYRSEAELRYRSEAESNRIEAELKCRSEVESNRMEAESNRIEAELRCLKYIELITKAFNATTHHPHTVGAINNPTYLIGNANMSQFARDIKIENSPGTNIGIANLSNNITTTITQMPESENKSVLQQLQEEIASSTKISPEDREAALYQVQALANMPNSQLTPMQRSTARAARDFLIGVGAGLFANYASKFLIPS